MNVLMTTKKLFGEHLTIFFLCNEIFKFSNLVLCHTPRFQPPILVVYLLQIATDNTLIILNEQRITNTQNAYGTKKIILRSPFRPNLGIIVKTYIGSLCCNTKSASNLENEKEIYLVNLENAKQLSVCVFFLQKNTPPNARKWRTHVYLSFPNKSKSQATN